MKLTLEELQILREMASEFNLDAITNADMGYIYSSDGLRKRSTLLLKLYQFHKTDESLVE